MCLQHRQSGAAREGVWVWGCWGDIWYFGEEDLTWWEGEIGMNSDSQQWTSLRAASEGRPGADGGTFSGQAMFGRADSDLIPEPATARRTGPGPPSPAAAHGREGADARGAGCADRATSLLFDLVLWM